MQKQEIKDLAATKPIQYINDNVPTHNEVRQDCISYVRDFYPEWNLFQENYFYEMVKSTIPTIVRDLDI